MFGMGGLFLFLADRLRWDRSRWVLLLLFSHVLFGLRAGVYDETKSIRMLRRFMDMGQFGTPFGIASLVSLLLAIGLLFLFLLYEDES